MRLLTKQFIGLLSLDLVLLTCIGYILIPTMVRLDITIGLIASIICGCIVLADITFGFVKYRALTKYHSGRG